MNNLRYIIATTVLAAGAILSAAAQDPWRIEVADINPSEYFGVTVANGQTGVFSSPNPLRTERVTLGGVYDIYGKSRTNNFVQGIRMLDVELKINGTRINRNNISDYTQTLDMRRGFFEGAFDYGDVAKVEYRYMGLRHLPFNCMMEVTVNAQKDINLDVTNILSAHESHRQQQEYFEQISNPPYKYHVAITTVKAPNSDIDMAASSVIIPDRRYTEPVIAHYNNRGYVEHAQGFDVKLKAGQDYRFYIIGTTVSSVTHPNVRNEVTRLATHAAIEGPERLLAKHLSAWDKLWESDIEIGGDPQSQQDVHNMLYHAYSFLRPESGLSVSPMGLSGFGYGGHIFWDAETWVYPGLLLLQPELAKSMLDYRYERLDAARRNAYSHGYRGAMYPWESAATGMEDISVHNHYGNFEVHVNADIALAAWQYYLVTGDKDWLREKGYPMLKETADFWVSRVDPRADGSGYELINVIGADEWAKNTGGGKNVNNNAYATAAAKANLLNAAKAAKVLGLKADPEWRTVADGLRFERMDNGVIREHDTYNGAIIKQIDVGLLAYPFSFLTDPADIRKNIEYYLPKMPRKATPAMSKSVYSILFSQIGDKDKAWEYFLDSYIPNLNPPFRVMAEFDGGTNPYFITGAGGTLQTVLMGFGGIRITDKGIEFTGANVPEQWSSLTFKGIGPDKKTIKLK